MVWILRSQDPYRSTFSIKRHLAYPHFKMKEKDLLLILFFTLQKAVAKDQ